MGLWVRDWQSDRSFLSDMRSVIIGLWRTSSLDVVLNTFQIFAISYYGRLVVSMKLAGLYELFCLLSLNHNFGSKDSEIESWFRNISHLFAFTNFPSKLSWRWVMAIWIRLKRRFCSWGKYFDSCVLSNAFFKLSVKITPLLCQETF